MRTKQDLTTQQINLDRDCTPDMKTKQDLTSKQVNLVHDMRTKQDLTSKQVNLVHNMTNIRDGTPVQISEVWQEKSTNDIAVSSCSIQDISNTSAKLPGNPDLEQCNKKEFSLSKLSE